MAILNQPEIEANIASRFPDNTSGFITPALLRAQAQDQLDSQQSYGGVISGGPASTVPATTIPTKVTTFDTNDTPTPNALLEADHVNNMVKVFEPARYLVTLRFTAEWATTEDLKILVYVNGAPSLLTPLEYAQKGEGTGNPISKSFSRLTLIIQAADIAAGPGGAYAEVEAFFGSNTGDFTLEQVKLQLGVEYGPLSIRTVG
jgi:hypothetical protein